MHVLIAHDMPIPARKYGGVERLIWWLGKELTRLGHTVSYLAGRGSECPFAKKVYCYDSAKSFNLQIPQEVDLIHFFLPLTEPIQKPHIMNYQYNFFPSDTLPLNTCFASRNHARRHGSECFVHHGLDPEDFGPVDFSRFRRDLLYYAYAKRPEKNLKGCLRIARKSGEVLKVVGGKPKWYKCRPWVNYSGFLGGQEKLDALGSTRALLYPVRWHEPFGLSITEAMYFGNPVLGTPYGSLPEIVTGDVGFLSDREGELIQAVKDLERFDPKACHARVMEHFTSRQMTQKYLQLYAKVLNGETLNNKPPKNPGNFDPKHLLPYYQ